MNNVEKRIEFITKETERMDKLEIDFQSRQEEKRKNIIKLQDDFRKIIMQMQQAQASQQQQVQQ